MDINLPDGKSSGQLAFIEAAPVELQDDYPTPVHVFTYDGRDSEPVHRTDVHLDGEAMTLDPVKGVPVHNAAQAHGGDRRPADLAKAASAAANRTPVRMRTRPAASSTRASMPYRLTDRLCGIVSAAVGYAGGRRFLCRGREGGGRCLLEDDGDIPAGLLGPLQVRPPHTWPPRGAWAPYRFHGTSLHLPYGLASGSPVPAARRSPGAPPGAMSGSSRYPPGRPETSRSSRPLVRYPFCQDENAGKNERYALLDASRFRKPTRARKAS